MAQGQKAMDEKANAKAKKTEIRLDQHVVSSGYLPYP